MTNYTALNIYGTYNKVFSEKHNFTVMLGYNLENSYKEGLSVTASEMINDELPSISQSVGEKNRMIVSMSFLFLVFLDV